MALIRRRLPLPHEVSSLHDAIDRLFDENLSRVAWPFEMRGAREIPLDVFEEGDEIVVKASAPGIKADDLHVEVRDDVLRIWGEVKEDKERQEKDYYMREHRYGRIERSVTLPCPVKTDKAKAVFEDGMLTLNLPKAAEVHGKEIKVQIKN